MMLGRCWSAAATPMSRPAVWECSCSSVLFAAVWCFIFRQTVAALAHFILICKKIRSYIHTQTYSSGQMLRDGLAWQTMTATVPVRPLKKDAKDFLCCTLDVVCLVDMV